MAAAHEDLTPRAPVRTASERAFGLVFTVVFALIGAYPMLSGAPPRWWSLAVTVAFLAAAFGAPAILAPLNRAWMRLGALLHAIVSPIVLGVMFYGVVAPTGLLMRLFRKDPLRLRFDRAAETYWIERQPPGPPPESFKDPF